MTQSSPNWDIVFETQLPRVYNYFLYRVNNRQVAEDLTSTTFERAWSSREGYREDIAAFSTWLFTIAHRVAVDYFRKKTAQFISIEDVYHLASNDSLEKIIQAQFDKERLANAISQLPEREQEIISMKYGAELSNQEIAELLGLSASNVGTIAHRSVQQLRRLLQDEEVETYHGTR